MIVPMKKYAFLVHHRDYDHFLEALGEIGVLHLRERRRETTDILEDRRQQQKRLQEAITFLEKRVAGEGAASPAPAMDGMEVVEAIDRLRAEQEQYHQELHLLDKELISAAPWGDFSGDTLEQLRRHGVYFHFFVCPVRKFQDRWRQDFNLQTIAVEPPNHYFIIISSEPEAPAIDAEEVPPPPRSVSRIRELQEALRAKIEAVEGRLGTLAQQQLGALRQGLAEVQRSIHWEEVRINTEARAGGAVMLLEGFVPEPKEPEFLEFCQRQGIVYFVDLPTPDDHPPVLLTNNRFTRLFEPIGELFALPTYQELDLTPFFAPFFMMFFGFCLGDAGYGVALLLVTTFYKRRAEKKLRPVLTLAQYLALATIFFGALTGTFFGINLLEDRYAWLGGVQKLMLNSDGAFKLALVLGGIQLLFGLVLQAANRWRQYGPKYAVPVVGWFILLVSLAVLALVKEAGPVAKYGAWGGVALILLFNDPDVGILQRLGKGIWELYGLTGFFGDLLSYIRLFALGISSAILGFVINDIAGQIKDAIPVLGPVLFVVFLLVGHGLNMLISGLGAFVHPLRLTFVEFYKNAGFAGGGKAYNPFSVKKENQ